LKQPNATKEKVLREPTPEEFMALIPADAMWPKDNPLAGLLSTDELKAEFKRRKYDRTFLASMRDYCEKKGLAGVVTEARNAKLVGRPAAVAAYKRWKAARKEQDSAPPQRELVE